MPGAVAFALALLTLVTWPLAARAQQAAKVSCIGLLDLRTAPASAMWLALYNDAMADVLIILEPSITTAHREAVIRAAPATQAISNRVFLAAPSNAALAGLQSMAGVARVLTGAEPTQSLPQLDDAEMLFVQAWLSTRGQVKQRRGEGLDWDTPPMVPPDPKR